MTAEVAETWYDEDIMTHYLIIFGRTPELSLLELQRVASYFQLQVEGRVAKEIALVSVQKKYAPEQLHELQLTLGGTVRIAELCGSSPKRDQIVTLCQEITLKHAAPTGKLTLGISTWADQGKPHPAFRLARDLKHGLTERGRSVRMITPASPYNQLSAPQLIHNKLLHSTAFREQRAFELIVLWANHQWHVAITQAVQDIADYTRRDFGIPKPNAVSGMLPPKLAQTMINLAVGGDRQLSVYDPFCGNGRILLEATLLNLPAYGSDILDQQVADSQANLAWLAQEYGVPAVDSNQVWQADATKGPGQALPKPFVIVTEPYLGKPLRQRLKPEEEQPWLDELVHLYDAFITVWQHQQPHPDRMVIVFPQTVSQTGRELSVFGSLVDRFAQIGYSAKVLFSYERPDSIVRRDLVEITYL